MRKIVGALGGLIAFALVWEGYKAVGNPEGTTVLGVKILPRADDLSMPHLLTVAQRLGRPELTGGRPVWQVVFDACLFTLGVTAVGFVAGTAIGFVLATLMQRFRVVERGLLPYVVLSQTVPLVALAPLIAGWSGALSFGPYPWQDWMTVSVIASYLAFFPVAVGLLRGLQSPSAAGVELMRSYAAGRAKILWKLRIPASFPFLFTALKIAAPAAVVGAIIGELPSSIQDGLAGAILNFNQYYITSPESLWATNIIAALLGILFFVVVALAERLLVRRAPENVA